MSWPEMRLMRRSPNPPLRALAHPSHPSRRQQPTRPRVALERFLEAGSMRRTGDDGQEHPHALADYQRTAQRCGSHSPSSLLASEELGHQKAKSRRTGGYACFLSTVPGMLLQRWSRRPNSLGSANPIGQANNDLPHCVRRVVVVGQRMRDMVAEEELPFALDCITGRR